MVDLPYRPNPQHQQCAIQSTKRGLEPQKSVSQQEMRETKHHASQEKEKDATAGISVTSWPFPSTDIMLEKLKTSKPAVDGWNPRQRNIISRRIESLRQDSRTLEPERSPLPARQCSPFGRSMDNECSCPEHHYNTVQKHSPEPYRLKSLVNNNTDSFSQLNIPDSPVSLGHSASDVVSSRSKNKLARQNGKNSSTCLSMNFSSSPSMVGKSYIPRVQHEHLDSSITEESHCKAESGKRRFKFKSQKQQQDSGFKEHLEHYLPMLSPASNIFQAERSHLLPEDDLKKITWTSTQTRLVFTGTSGKFVQQNWSCAKIYQKLMDIVFVERKIHFDSILEMPLTDDAIRQFYFDNLPDYFDLPLDSLKFAFKNFYVDGKDKHDRENVQTKQQQWLREMKDAFYIYRDKRLLGMSPEVAIIEACHLAKDKKSTPEKGIKSIPQNQEFSNPYMNDIISCLRIRGGQGTERGSMESTTTDFSAVSSVTSRETQQMEVDNKNSESPPPSQILKRKGSDDLFPPRKRPIREKRVRFVKEVNKSANKKSMEEVCSDPEPDFVIAMQKQLRESSSRASLSKEDPSLEGKTTFGKGTRGKAIKASSYSKTPAAS